MCTWLGIANIINTPGLPNLICFFNPNQNPNSYLVNIDKLILKFIRGGKRPGTGITTLKKQNNVEDLTLPNIELAGKLQ